MAPTARSAAAKRREASRRESELTQERALDPDWVPMACDEGEMEDISTLEVNAFGELDRRDQVDRLPASSMGDVPSDDAPGARGRDVGMIVRFDADLVPNGCPTAVLGKRTHSNEDLRHPEAPPPAPRGQSTTTMWRNANNMTKKSRAINMQKSIASIFSRKNKEPKRPRVDLGQSVHAMPPCDPNGGNDEHEHPPTSSIPNEVTGEMAEDRSSREELHASPDTEPPSLACTSPVPELSPPARTEPEELQAMEDVVGSCAEWDTSPVDTLSGGDLQDAGSVTSDSEDEEGEVDDEEATNEAARTLTLNAKLSLLRKKLIRNNSPQLSLEKLDRELERVRALEQYSKKLDERQQARDQAFARARQTTQGALRYRLRKSANKIRPAAEASAHVARGRDHGVYFARQLRVAAEHVRRTGELPENRQGKGAVHATNFENPEVKKHLKRWADREIDESKGGLGKNRPTPDKLLNFVNVHLFPQLGIDATISMTTAVRWLKWLGFYCTRHTKGIYWDGHERKDVVAARKAFIELMDLSVLPFAYQYEDKSLSETAPTIPAGTKIHYPIFHDETCFQANDQTNSLWLREGEQELRSKSRGRNVHVSDFIIEKSENGRLALTPDEIAREELLPAPPLPPSSQHMPTPSEAIKGKGRKGKTKASPTAIPVATDRTTAAADDWTPPPPPAPHTRYRLPTYDARQIIYPGAGHDPYWDMPQLLVQVKRAIDIFDVKFPEGTAVFIFDCSSAHEAFASDALLAHKMNRYPGGAQPIMHDTKIPGTEKVQSMVFPADSQIVDTKGNSLAGKPKGMEQVLRERGLLSLLQEGGRKPVGTCGVCKQSAAAREKAAKLAKSKEDEIDGSGLEGREAIAAAVLAEAEDAERPINCCMQRLLASQPDFRDEKPLLQVLIEKRGHKCLFLPKFHCEFNPIEMVWGQAKTRFRKFSDGTFPTAKRLVPECLNQVTVENIRRYFRHCYRYMHAYKIGLNAQQAKYAVKKYSSHRRIPQNVFMDVNIILRQ